MTAVEVHTKNDVIYVPSICIYPLEMGLFDCPDDEAILFVPIPASLEKIPLCIPIISVGKNNRYGHPNKEVLDNLKDSKIYRIDQDGSTMFKIKNNKIQYETCSP